ncbi:restriction endonuclease subunit S [Burkholderia gladioli]|uniref:restriction endonuclease subunit S n=1 Tax=Burkholderia gladioli TaxID=28095 RepID=UPI00163F34E0|nr:restriction endonuclease subunit S [Burkholderia gladioli]
MNKASNEKRALVPRLRFPNFRDAEGWGSEFGNKVFDQVSNKNHNSDLPVLAITQEHGAIPRNLIDYHVSVAEKSIEGYKVVEAGDFIISLRSFQGGIEYSKYRGICSPAYVILRLKHGHSADYFRQFLKTDRFITQLNRNLEGLRDGKMVSYKQFSELPLPAPSQPEQQKIADCLSSLDDLIAAESQKLDALNVHKEGLVQELFPRVGETIPRMRFPEFRDAGEWTGKPFDRFVVKSFYGTSSSTSESGQYPVLRMGNMIDGRLDFSNLVYIDLDPDSFAKIRLVRGDILLNRTNSPDLVGKISMFDRDIECISASYIVTYRLDKEQLDPAFCNFMLNAKQYQAKIKALARPSISQANINPTTFRNELVVSVPKIAEQQRIASCLSALDERITAQGQKINILKAHKKGLLQLLFPVMAEGQA